MGDQMSEDELVEAALRRRQQTIAGAGQNSCVGRLLAMVIALIAVGTLMFLIRFLGVQ